MEKEFLWESYSSGRYPMKLEITWVVNILSKFLFVICKTFSSSHGYSDHGKGHMFCSPGVSCEYVGPGALSLSQGILEALGWGDWDLPSLTCLAFLQKLVLSGLFWGQYPHMGAAATSSGADSITLWVPSWWHSLVQPCGVQVKQPDAFTSVHAELLLAWLCFVLATSYS